jgi:hypothetical protein
MKVCVRQTNLFVHFCFTVIVYICKYLCNSLLRHKDMVATIEVLKAKLKSREKWRDQIQSLRIS